MRWFCFLFSVFFLRVYRAQCTALRSNQKVISAASDALEEKPHEPFDEEKADKEDEEETEEERGFFRLISVSVHACFHAL